MNSQQFAQLVAKAERESRDLVFLVGGANGLPDAWRERVLRHEGATYLLSLASYAELESLLSALRKRGIAIAELALQEADLEQVFLRIMKRTA